MAKAAPAPVKAAPVKEHKPVALASVGDIVNYYSSSPSAQYHGNTGPYAAMVTRVNDGTVDVVVFPSSHIPPQQIHNITDQVDKDHWFESR